MVTHASSDLRSSLDPALLSDILNEETRRKMLAEPMLAQLKDEYARGERFLMNVAARGIRIGVGSDSGAGVIPMGWGTHHEMQLFVKAGLTPMQALRAATGEAAALLQEGEPDFGTIEPGKAADLLVLAADPLAEIGNTRKIERLMQAGQWIDRAEPPVQ
jgi:imidazolonepropionase-like amidohydrolase